MQSINFSLLNTPVHEIDIESCASNQLSIAQMQVAYDTFVKLCAKTNKSKITFPSFNTFCTCESTTQILANILTAINQSVSKISTNKYNDGFNVLFATEHMKNTLTKLFCEQPTLIMANKSLLEYCDKSFVDMPVAEHYNTLTYLLSNLNNSQDIDTVCFLLDSIKESKTEDEIIALFTACPKDKHVLNAPFFSDAKKNKIQPTVELQHTVPFGEETVIICNPSYDIRGTPSRWMHPHPYPNPTNIKHAPNMQFEQNVDAQLMANKNVPLKTIENALTNMIHSRDNNHDIQYFIEKEHKQTEHSVVFDIPDDTPTVQSKSPMSKLFEKLIEFKYPFEYFTNVVEVLNKAYTQNNFELFKYLLSTKIADINSCDEFGMTTLTHIINNDKTFSEKVHYIDELLGNSDINVSIPNNLNQTPLLLFMKKYLVPSSESIRVPMPSIFEMASVNPSGSRDMSIGDISYAKYPDCFDNQPFCDGWKIDSVSKSGCVPEVPVVKPEITPIVTTEYDIFEKLLNHPTCNPNIEDINGDIPVFNAMKKKHIRAVSDIIKSDNFDMIYAYGDGSTPIIKLVKMLLEHTTFDDCEIEFYLLDKLCELDVFDDVDLYGKNALTYASEKDNGAIFKKLLSYNIESDILKPLLDEMNEQNMVVNARLIEKKIAENTAHERENRWFYFF